MDASVHVDVSRYLVSVLSVDVGVSKYLVSVLSVAVSVCVGVMF